MCQQPFERMCKLPWNRGTRWKIVNSAFVKINLSFKKAWSGQSQKEIAIQTSLLPTWGLMKFKANFIHLASEFRPSALNWKFHIPLYGIDQNRHGLCFYKDSNCWECISVCSGQPQTLKVVWLSDFSNELKKQSIKFYFLGCQCL